MSSTLLRLRNRAGTRRVYRGSPTAPRVAFSHSMEMAIQATSSRSGTGVALLDEDERIAERVEDTRDVETSVLEVVRLAKHGRSRC